MKEYKIYAFEKYGVFFCKEVQQPNGEIFLVGKFNNKGKEFTLIKNHKDIELIKN